MFNFDLNMSIFDEFTTSFGKEFYTRTEFGTLVRENCTFSFQFFLVMLIVFAKLCI